MKDINEVIRRKRAEQTRLGKQIETLQGAVDMLRSVAHLLSEDDDRLAPGNGQD